jgi:transposase-like protein
MSVLSKPYFHNEEAAFEHVEAMLWADGPTCPKCGSLERIYSLKGVHSKPTKKHPKGVIRHGLKKCAACRAQFTVRVGTIFEDSHIPLHKWLQAIHLICSSKKGCSSNQLHRTLEITLKSAWFLSHRIREAMRNGDFSPMGGNGKTVEIDETYIGRLEGVDKQKTGWAHKNTVLTLVERGGIARSFHITSATKAVVLPIVNTNISKESAVMTDQAPVYKKLGKTFADHGSVDHSKDEYVRVEFSHNGEKFTSKIISTNTVEGFYSIFKRGMKGIYQHRYLAEFDFRYNNRVALGIDDGDRALKALLGVKGRRLTYRGAY